MEAPDFCAMTYSLSRDPENGARACHFCRAGSRLELSLAQGIERKKGYHGRLPVPSGAVRAQSV
jgi:hypothetical protein